MVFQVFLILFACFAMYKIWQQYRADKVSGHWLRVWTILWVVVILVALWPQTTDLVAERVGVGRGADLLVYIAIVFLMYGFARVLSTQEKQRQELTDLVRKLAIDHADMPGEDGETIEEVVIVESGE